MGKKSRRQKCNGGLSSSGKLIQGMLNGVDKRFVSQANLMRYYLFDTKTPNGCHHGAIQSIVHEERSMFVKLYFAERAKDEAEGAPLGFTNIRFLHQYGAHINQEHCNLLLYDAANHTLRGDYASARILARIHMAFNCFLQAGKPPVPFEGQDVKEYVQNEHGLPAWFLEMSKLLNTIETPFEVTKYISKFIPCSCLAESKKAAKKEADQRTSCHYCKKAVPSNELKCCSKCNAAFYCSRECQVRLNWFVVLQSLL